MKLLRKVYIKNATGFWKQNIKKCGSRLLHMFQKVCNFHLGAPSILNLCHITHQSLHLNLALTRVTAFSSCGLLSTFSGYWCGQHHPLQNPILTHLQPGSQPSKWPKLTEICDWNPQFSPQPSVLMLVELRKALAAHTSKAICSYMSKRHTFGSLVNPNVCLNCCLCSHLTVTAVMQHHQSLQTSQKVLLEDVCRPSSKPKPRQTEQSHSLAPDMKGQPGGGVCVIRSGVWSQKRSVWVLSAAAGRKDLRRTLMQVIDIVKPAR